jgi:hypothetical protein
MSRIPTFTSAAAVDFSRRARIPFVVAVDAFGGTPAHDLDEVAAFAVHE